MGDCLSGDEVEALGGRHGFLARLIFACFEISRDGLE